MPNNGCATTGPWRFQYYRWAENLIGAICDLLPPFLRTLVLRSTFKRFGAGSVIDYGSRVRYPWLVAIGDGVMINQECRVYPSYSITAAEITIGDNAVFSPGVTLCGAGHDYSQLALPDTAGSTRIGARVWIGANALVLPGVEIGEGSVIGAGSVVTKSIPAWSVAVGNPAKIIGQRIIRAAA